MPDTGPWKPPIRKRFGQHFLEAAWVAKLVAAIEPRSGELFLEIGAGRGELTRPIVAAGARVVAVEIDRALAAALSSLEFSAKKCARRKINPAPNAV